MISEKSQETNNMSNGLSVFRDGSGSVKFSFPYTTVEKRRGLGKSRRESIPRRVHARWAPPPSRRDPIEIIVESNKGRLRKLIPIRYGRMMKSPLAFLRGSAAIMAYDLSFGQDTGIRSQACGDCHLSNFGVFATPERNVIFDINDFDETLPAPFEWDVKRLATSFFVAGKGNGFSEKKCTAIVRSMIGSYRDAMQKFAKMQILEQWYSRADADLILTHAPEIPTKRSETPTEEKALSQHMGHINPGISNVVGGRRHIVERPPLIYHPPEKWHLEEQFVKALEEYRKSLPQERRILYDRYHLEDISIKVVGIGSVGTRCLIMLYGAEKDDRLLLQVKEARHSVLEPYAGKGVYVHQGKRVVVGQRIMQSASDIFLGWMTDPQDGIQYYVRQLRDMKYSPDTETMSSEWMGQYASLCGWTLARAHAKGGDAAVIGGYIGKNDIFDRAICDFAREYAGQVRRDYDEFVTAIKSGRLGTLPEKRSI